MRKNLTKPKLLDNLNQRFPAAKYKGKTVKWVLENDPEYINNYTCKLFIVADWITEMAYENCQEEC